MRNVLRQGLATPVSRIDLVRELCRGKDVLDLGCVQHDAEQANNAAWLHQALVDVAASVVGVDYSSANVAKLMERGYSVITADVTKPLPVEGSFDVIVVGNLIEHLSNFEGLFVNLARHLRPGGRVAISSANPFYREQYFYAAFRNDILVNPEHTCWIDPVTLNQLAGRFGFVTEAIRWVEEGWKLSQMIRHGRNGSYDMFSGRWIFDEKPSLLESLLSPLLERTFLACAPRAYADRVLQKHGRAHARRLLFQRFLGALFDVFWLPYRQLIVTSRINRYELYVSVLRRQD
jgi:SAM-dependent methyltransferase